MVALSIHPDQLTHSSHSTPAGHGRLAAVPQQAALTPHLLVQATGCAFDCRPPRSTNELSCITYAAWSGTPSQPSPMSLGVRLVMSMILCMAW